MFYLSPLVNFSNKKLHRAPLKVVVADLSRVLRRVAKRSDGSPRRHRRVKLSIGGIVSKETVCCVGGKVKH